LTAIDTNDPESHLKNSLLRIEASGKFHEYSNSFRRTARVHCAISSESWSQRSSAPGALVAMAVAAAAAASMQDAAAGTP